MQGFSFRSLYSVKSLPLVEGNVKSGAFWFMGSGIGFPGNLTWLSKLDKFDFLQLMDCNFYWVDNNVFIAAEVSSKADNMMGTSDQSAGHLTKLALDTAEALISCKLTL